MHDFAKDFHFIGPSYGTFLTNNSYNDNDNDKFFQVLFNIYFHFGQKILNSTNSLFYFWINRIRNV